jgi:hypothetical protein
LIQVLLLTLALPSPLVLKIILLCRKGEVSFDEHGITIAIKAVSFLDGFLIGSADTILSGKS